MITFLIVTGWLITCIIGYRLNKKSWTQDTIFPEWTKGVRALHLALCLLGPVSVLAGLIHLLVDELMDDDRPASWCLIPLTALLLPSCTPDYSFECSGCVQTTEQWAGDKKIGTSRQNQPCYSGKSDSTYYRGDTLFIRKMVCK